MERYKLQERIEIIEIHYKNGENLAETVRKTRTFLGRREAIKELVEKFELLGQVSDVKNKTRSRRSRTAENIAAVAESIEENPGLSIPRRSLELGIPHTSLHRILHKDLGIKAYKVQLTQELKPADHQQRRVFADWVVDLDNVYFQQDGSACHTRNETIDLLREKLPNLVISRRGDHNWLKRFCDLTPCDFFFWGRVKEKIYANSPATLRFSYGKFH